LTRDNMSQQMAWKVLNIRFALWKAYQNAMAAELKQTIRRITEAFHSEK
jgi:hypothetical protein